MATAQQTYAMLEQTTLWETAELCHRALAEAEIPHALLGGMAVCLHGYQRSTVDVDLLVRREDAERVRAELEAAGLAWDAKQAEFRGQAGIPVQFVLAGERAGKGSEVLLPDPAESRTWTLIEGLPVLKLARLIETKLACGSGNVRRTHKDFADVLELIVVHDLSRAFARFLHKSLRATFRELVVRARAK
jgi:hypothetical protein